MKRTPWKFSDFFKNTIDFDEVKVRLIIERITKSLNKTDCSEFDIRVFWTA